MNSTPAMNHSGFSRLKLFLALSRTPHGLLDIATPALGALLVLGTIPSASVIILGFITAFAGYTAVYAMNDVVDYRTDKAKIQEGNLCHTAGDLDAVYVRHPMAQGLLGLREGLLWTGAWSLVAVAGAYALNPTCALIFLAGCLLETIYCLMLRVSYLRTLVSGAVKTCGGIAAAFAVDPNPSPLFLILLFSWLFLWEIGGQNVPNDWTDLEEDQCLKADTLPVRFGARGASQIILGCLAASTLLSLLLFLLTPAEVNLLHLLAVLAANIFLLIVPAYRLYHDRTRTQASALFNRASYYPLAMFAIITISVLS